MEIPGRSPKSAGAEGKARPRSSAGAAGFGSQPANSIRRRRLWEICAFVVLMICSSGELRENDPKVGAANPMPFASNQDTGICAVADD
jgi:hypothetical protein